MKTVFTPNIGEYAIFRAPLGMPFFGVITSYRADYGLYTIHFDAGNQILCRVGELEAI